MKKLHLNIAGITYLQVISRERRGDFLGKTVQVVPHVTDTIQDWVTRVAHIPVSKTGEEPDVCVVELGGTIGDIEGTDPFALYLFQDCFDGSRLLEWHCTVFK